MIPAWPTGPGRASSNQVQNTIIRRTLAAVPARAWLAELFFQAAASSAGVKEALQNEHRGYLIDHRAAISRLAAGRIQVTMGLGGP